MQLSIFDLGQSSFGSAGAAGGWGLRRLQFVGSAARLAQSTCDSLKSLHIFFDICFRFESFFNLVASISGKPQVAFEVECPWRC